MKSTLFTLSAQVRMTIPADSREEACIKFEQALEHCGTDASVKGRVEVVDDDEMMAAIDDE